jgi:type IV secretion/conjugal transfer VirB4 family ATPase
LSPDSINFFDIFAYGLSTKQVIIAAIGIISASAFAVLSITKLGEKLLPKPRETRVCDFLPFARLLPDGITIKCKDGSLCRVYRVGGADTAFIMPNQREQLLDSKQQWVDVNNELNVTARVITVREMLPLEENAPHDNSLLKRIALQWNRNLARVYRNNHYIVLSIKDYKDALRDLDQAGQALIATLDEYDAQVMREDSESDAKDSPFYLFARLCSPLTRPAPKVGNSEGEDLNALLTSDYVHFTGEKGVINFIAGEKTKKCIVMGVRAAGDYMDEQMISDLLAIDVELNLVHNITPIPKMKAVAWLMQQRRMTMATSLSGSNVDQYTEALEALDAADETAQTLCEYAMTVYVYGDSLHELEFGQTEVERICRLYNVTPVREGWVAEAAFFSQFPTYDVYPRPYSYLSRVVACAVCFEKTSEGNVKSDWGEGAITVFRTYGGTAYNWQFHVTAAANAVAHCVIIGPTGQGKTTLLAFLAGQAMRHRDLHVYFFDRHRGVEIFTRAIGGAYINFDGDKEATSLNPFSCEDTPENRAFLRRWLKAITMVDDAVSEKEIGRAVTTAFDYLRPEERTLKNLHKSCFSPTGAMRRELFRWVNDQQYGLIFNSTNDDLDLTAKFMAFDFTHIFEDETLAPAVISYIMHRIHELTGRTGEPSLIMIDETAPMLKHPMFRDSFIVGLQEGRKKRQAYLCAFQQPNIIDTLGLGEVVRGQCQTIIFFRNPQGMEEDYENWRLTPREKAFIFGREFKELKYAILVSRPAVGESVILDVDLSGLGPYLKLYSSGRKHVLLAEQLIREFGPDAFVEKYLEVA